MAPPSKALLFFGLSGLALCAPVPAEPYDVAYVVGTTQTGPKVNVTIGIPSASESSAKPVVGIPASSETAAEPAIGIPKSSESDADTVNDTTQAAEAEPHQVIGTPEAAGGKLNTTIGVPNVHDTNDAALEALMKIDAVKATTNENGVVSMLAMAPAMDQNFADPAIITDASGQYWAFATDDVAHTTSHVMVHSGFNVQVANSSDFMSWDYYHADALPYTGAWTANPPHIWAPDVVQLDDGTYVLYYAATPANATDSHCIGAAHAPNVTGPYTPVDHPLYCPTAEGGAIDPSGFRDPATNKRYVMFKVDGNNGQPGGACGNINPNPRATPIRMQEVNPSDGVSPIGDIVQILDRDNSDGALVEAPSMAAVPLANATGGYVYVLFYSSHCFLTPNYNVRYAVSTSGIWNGADNMANSPSIKKADYAKHPTPLMDTKAMNLTGPGGLDVHPDGRHVVFHAAGVADNPGTRKMHWGMIDINGENVSI